MDFTVEFERKDGGCWLAEVLELPGVVAYGDTRDAVVCNEKALSLRVVADQIEHTEYH